MNSLWRRAAAPVAVGLGPFVIAIVFIRNWHGWEAAPFWLDDVLAGAALTAAGFVALKEQGSVKGRLLSAAFAFTVAVLWCSFFERLAGFHPRPEHWSAVPAVAQFLTLLGMVVAVVGATASLPSRKPPFIGTRPEPEKKKGRR